MATLKTSLGQQDKHDNFVPAGEYHVCILTAEVKETKNGGERVLARFQVMDGNYGGRSFFLGFNTENDNAAAAEIGRSQLYSIGLAVGCDCVEDTDELVGKPFILKLRVKEGQLGKENDFAAAMSLPIVVGRTPAVAAQRRSPAPSQAQVNTHAQMNIQRGDAVPREEYAPRAGARPAGMVAQRGRATPFDADEIPY